MPLISQETVKKIKNEIQISAVLKWLDVHVVGNNKAFCPLCTDKNSRHPGLSFDDSLGVWHCFVHDAGGDVITLVQEYYGVSFTEAVELIAAKFDVEVKYDKDNISKEEQTKNALMIRALAYAQEIFIRQRKSKEYKNFINSRKLSQEAQDRFGIGMSCAKWSKAAVNRLTDKFDCETLINCGLCTKDKNGNLRLRYRDRATFPIKNPSGTIIGFGGRDITGHTNAKYINTNETPLFHKKNILYGLNTARRAISKSRSVIICEGYMDTIALQTHGFENAVGAMGTAVTEENLCYLSRIVDSLYLCLDADEAGLRSAMRVVSKIPSNYSPSILVITIPREISKDPDEWFNQAEQNTESFQKLIDSAIPLFFFCVRNTTIDDIKKIEDIKNNQDSINQTKLTELRRSIINNTNKIIMSNIEKIRRDEIVLIADWLIKTTGIPESVETVIAKWIGGRKNSLQNKKINKNSSSEEIIKQQPLAEDVLLFAAYNQPNDVSNVLTTILNSEFGDYVSNMMTKDIYQNILYKEMGCTDKDVLWNILDTEEKNELSRIITQCSCSSKLISFKQIQNIAWKIISQAIRKTIDNTEKQPMLDFTKLIKLRQQLKKVELLAKGEEMD